MPGTCFSFRPFHLLGIETGMSVLKAAQINPTAVISREFPRVDVFCRAEKDLPAGMVLEMDHAHRIAGVVAELGPFSNCAAEDSIPYYLASGHRWQAL